MFKYVYYLLFFTNMLLACPNISRDGNKGKVMQEGILKSVMIPPWVNKIIYDTHLFTVTLSATLSWLTLVNAVVHVKNHRTIMCVWWFLARTMVFLIYSHLHMVRQRGLRFLWYNQKVHKNLGQIVFHDYWSVIFLSVTE